MRSLIATILGLAFAASCGAAVKNKDVTYKYENSTFKGKIYWDDAKKEKRGGVLVVHEWWGINDYAKMRAEKLAELGYVAFACDLYGEGKSTDHPEDATKFYMALTKNKAAWVGRAQAALKVLADDEHVDATRLASIGYCLGGTTSLNLAFSGADLKAVATFHSGPVTPTADEAKKVKAKFLVCHGAEDKMIPAEAIKDFQKAMEAHKIALQFESYKGAVHSFTVPDADKHKIPGIAYNEAADKASWEVLKKLLAETIGEKK